MPRTRRAQSGSGIYHVVLRGINRQKIFEDNEDYERYLYTLKKYQEVSGYTLYAYCLMPNHIHLLIKEGDEDLGKVFRRVGSSFVYWYNLKYNRIGHLFQDRFKSEVVEDDSYLLTVIRYIHRNPVKAGICNEPEEYRYSSYALYESEPLIDSSLIFSMISREEFEHYQHISNEDSCLELEVNGKRRLRDGEAKKIMIEQYQCADTCEFGNFDKETQGNIIRTLLAEGGTLHQISRVTGASIGVIRKYR
ncbi:MAG: transposase [Eubacterium sp.]|nr:transposase [Eubacterium sp.]